MRRTRGVYGWAFAVALTACGSDPNADGEGGKAAAPTAARATPDAPTSLEIVLENDGNSGGEPACESRGLECGNADGWELKLRLDWSALAAGNVFPLVGLMTSGAFQGAAIAGACPGQPIGDNSGAVEVLSATSERVSIRVKGTAQVPGWSMGRETFDGVYEVAVCRARPAEDLALRHAIATTEATGAIKLHAASAEGTCEDPDALQAPGAHAGLVIELPPTMQAVGTYGLGGHTLVHYESDIASGEDDFAHGTITITEIDADRVRFELAGTGPWFSLEQSGDGSFVAQRCP